ncbi:MAG: hypothetical protein ACTSW1_07255 [Candidatus Hodarchaeales archaeon]
MKTSHAMFGLLVFGVLLYAGGYNTVGTAIFNALNLDDVSAWELVAIGTAATIVTGVILRFTGGNVLTAPMITAAVGLVSLPVSAFDSSVPLLVRFLVGGFWTFLMISGVGSAIGGDF